MILAGIGCGILSAVLCVLVGYALGLSAPLLVLVYILSGTAGFLGALFLAVSIRPKARRFLQRRIPS